MKITPNSIITLEDKRKYLVVTGEQLEGITFALISSIEPPIEMKVVELTYNDGETMIQKYTGGDYMYILKMLLEKANSENTKDN